MVRRHAAGGPLDPINVVLAGDPLQDRQPHDLMHGATFALGLPSQEDRLFIGEPKGHRHSQHDTTVLPLGPWSSSERSGRRPDPGGSGRRHASGERDQGWPGPVSSPVTLKDLSTSTVTRWPPDVVRWAS
jgi:hypothetical protein